MIPNHITGVPYKLDDMSILLLANVIVGKCSSGDA